MGFPKMKQPPILRKSLEAFGGYDHNFRVPEGAWYDMENLTSDGYPLLMPRACRGILGGTEDMDGITGITANHGICLTRGRYFYLPDGRQVDLELDDRPKQMVSMGAFVLIFPDKKWVNMAKAMQSTVALPGDAAGSMENSWEGTELMVCSCLSDGRDFQAGEIAEQRPENPTDGQLWRDYSVFPAVLKQWSDVSGSWVTDVSCWTRLEAAGIGKGFRVGDRLRVRGIPSDAAELSEHVLVSAVGEEDDYLVVEGQTVKDRALCVGQLELTRCLPEMDYVFECGNRLWGCRYGTGEAEAYNEIYCSKLGDFTNFYSFQGVSTDSYVASIGVDGPFTGGICFQGRPLFFKENTLIEILGDYPENYRVRTTGCDGVQPGCHRSLAIVNNVLYYQGVRGIFSFDGSAPVAVGRALGSEEYTAGVAAACRGKYYISMESSQSRQLFVLDTERKLWHREDSLPVAQLCGYRNEVYCLCGDRPGVLTLLGSSQPYEQRVSWLAESGRIGLSLPESKYLSRLNLRLSLAADADLRVSVSYEDGTWEHIYSLRGTGLRSFTLPIRPKRCDHMRLRLEGVGGARLYGISQTIEKGSEQF